MFEFRTRRFGKIEQKRIPGLLDCYLRCRESASVDSTYFLHGICSRSKQELVMKMENGTAIESTTQGDCHWCTCSCQNVGKRKVIGVVKDYCCPCFAKINKSYTRDKWCTDCRRRQPDPDEFLKERAGKFPCTTCGYKRAGCRWTNPDADCVYHSSGDDDKSMEARNSLPAAIDRILHG